MNNLALQDGEKGRSTRLLSLAELVVHTTQKRREEVAKGELTSDRLDNLSQWCDKPNRQPSRS
jgi:hypothetical protein